MAKYKIVFGDECQNSLFDTEEEAEEYALYLAACMRAGAEILYRSKMGDRNKEDLEDCFTIVEIEG